MEPHKHTQSSENKVHEQHKQKAKIPACKPLGQIIEQTMRRYEKLLMQRKSPKWNQITLRMKKSAKE